MPEMKLGLRPIFVPRPIGPWALPNRRARNLPLSWLLRRDEKEC